MTNIDWRKASLATPDPARVQKDAQFLPPDPIVVRITDLTAKEKKKIAAFEKLREEARAREKAVAKARRLRQQTARKQEKANAAIKAEKAAVAQKKRKELRVTRQRELASKIEAEEAWKRSPEYIAIQQAEAAQREEADRLRREALIAEREPLRQRWREQLLGRGTDPDQPSG
ncbi:hypothetical protein OSJ57_23895 [Sphingomonas sp. HH69]